VPDQWLLVYCESSGFGETPRKHLTLIRVQRDLDKLKPARTGQTDTGFGSRMKQKPWKNREEIELGNSPIGA
jgi:hypothetical protein